MLGFLYVPIAIGLSIVFGLLGIVNFAHGSFFALGAYFAVTLVRLLGWLAVLLAPFAAGLVGMSIEEVLDAVVRLSERPSLVIVEHRAETVLPIADRAVVLVNGSTVFTGSAASLAADEPLQSRLLGVAAPASHAA